MFKLDDNLLIELGLGSLPAVEKNRMLGHIYETLEMRVGMKLAQKMSNEQLDEFEAFINRNDEAGALKWLESNFPNYKQVVADELESLKTEIKTSAPQIVAASQQQAIAQTGPAAPSQLSQLPQQPQTANYQSQPAAAPAPYQAPPNNLTTQSASNYAPPASAAASPQHPVYQPPAQQAPQQQSAQTNIQPQSFQQPAYQPPLQQPLPTPQPPIQAQPYQPQANPTSQPQSSPTPQPTAPLQSYDQAQPATGQNINPQYPPAPLPPSQAPAADN